MARYTFKSDANDSTIRSLDADYATARAGSALAADDIVSTLAGAGQFFDGSNHILRQGFLQYTHTAVATATELCTNATIVFEGFENLPDGDPWSLQMREYDWGATNVAADDWIPGNQVGNLAPTVLGEVAYIREQRPAPAHWRTGCRTELKTRLATSTALRIVGLSNKLVLGWAPGPYNRTVRDEFVHWGTSEGGPNYFRPRLEYQTTRLSSLTRVQGASAQLSDGTQVWLDADTPGTILLKHNPTGTTYNTVATVPIGTDSDRKFRLVDGANALSLVVDASDNIYIVGPSGQSLNALTIKCYLKGSGYSWTTPFAPSAFINAYDADINQVVATYHASGGGYVVAVVGHSQGYSFKNQTVAVVMDASRARSGIAGSMITDMADLAPQRLGTPLNATGNGIDVLALNSRTGAIAVLANDTAAGEAAKTLRMFGYYITTAGKWVTGAAPSTSNSNTNLTQTMPGSVADGDSSVKLMLTGASRFTALAEGQLWTWTNFDNFTLTGSRQTITTAAVSTWGSSATQPQNAAYDPAANRVWVFYLDTANGRRLMRTGYNPNTGLLDNSQTEVATNLGASGSTHVSIRVGRGTLDERKLLIHLGNRSATNVHTTVATAYTGLNQAPQAPVLTNPGSFSSTVARVLRWVYADPNPRDQQTAHQIEIRNATTLALAYNPGKLSTNAPQHTLPALTLSNNVAYEWRVRVYDAADVVSPYSAYQAFSTTSSGTTTITVPATDNAAGLASSSVAVTWEYTGALAQAKYRVRVVRTDTGAQVFDTGFVNGPAVTTYTVTGLISDVEQRIEVLIEDSGTNVSNTATRLVTPNYSSPDAPTITAQPSSDGAGIDVIIDNPIPTGVLPSPTKNEVYRSLANADAFIKVGECEPDGIFTDYGAAAGVLYDYQVAAVATGPRLSNIAEDASTTFLGLYLHDPIDPPGTVRHYLYGGASKSEKVDTPTSELQFVGRAYPVFEFGERLGESVDVSLMVPFDDDWNSNIEFLREVSRSRRVWCYRDSRGRKVFGPVRAVAMSDRMAGTEVSLTVTRADYTEELA